MNTTNIETTDKQLNSFLNFLNLEAQEEAAQKISEFLSAQQVNDKREVIYDRGQLLMMVGDKLLGQVDVQSENDRVVRFDGVKIEEVNPYAYLKEIQMKGDDSSKRRSGTSSDSSMGSNNNNNNNNNNG